MKRLLLIIVAIAWVGLSTCPAYADNNGANAEPNKVENQQQNKETPSGDEREKKQNDKASENQQQDEKSSDDNNPRKPGEDPSGGVTPDDPSKEISIKDTMIASLVLTLLVLIVSLLSLWLVYRKFNKALLVVQEDMFKMEQDLKDYEEKISKLQEKIASCESNLKNVKNELSALKGDLTRLISEVQSQPKEKEVVAPPIYQEKIWYGTYESGKEGFTARYLTENREKGSQFVIRQKSDTTAEFSIIEDITNDLFSGAIGGCNLLEGDPMNFVRISEERAGRLTLEGNTWRVVEPVQIRLF